MNHSPAIQPSRSGRQAGFSLIELMIAIVIAMVVTAGAVAVFGNMRSSFTAQDRLGQLQDGQRLALTVLNTTVQSTGFFVLPLEQTPDTAFAADATPANPDGSTFADARVIVGSGDVLNVRYQASLQDGLMNCRGEPSAKTGASPLSAANFDTVLNSFQVTGNQLTCSVRKQGEAAWQPAVALVDNVESMKLSYLVDKGGTYAYLNAAGVTAGNFWTKVTAVRITLQFFDPHQPGVKLPYENVQTINLMNKS